MFNQYPYLNLNDLNLDYILKAIKEMRYEVTNFVSINAIKYADPIQWNITSQYEKNTIVIDPVTGTAYISVAPVPAGVALTRPEYWTVVFDLGSFVTRAAQNFTRRWESDTTLTATFATPAGAWLVWGDVLYKALVNISAGDTYVVGSNIEHFTIEDLYNAYLNTITLIMSIIGDLDDLATSDKTSVVNAINNVVNVVIGDLDDLNTADKTSVVNAINDVLRIVADYANAIGRRIDLVEYMVTMHIESSGATAATFSMVTGDWFILDDALYMARTNINIGDTYIIGTNIIQKSIEDFMRDINLRITTEVSTLNNKINAIKPAFDPTKKNVLFIGDSWGDQSVIGSTVYPELVNNYLHFNSYANLCVGGAGFYSPSDALKFVTQLINYSGDRNAITDIYIIDATNNCKTTDPTSQFYINTMNEMTNFNNYAKNNYPNAVISYGFVGNAKDAIAAAQIPGYIADYIHRQYGYQWLTEKAQTLGWKILNNTQYIMCSYQDYFKSDGNHPNASGQFELGKGIARAIYSGSADPMSVDINALAQNVFPISNGNIKFKMNRGLASLYSNNYVRFSIPENTTFDVNLMNIAFLTRNYFNKDVCIPTMARLYSTQIGDAYMPAHLIFKENKMSIILHGIFNDGTSSTYVTNFTAGAGCFLELLPFEFEFNSIYLA